MEIWLDGFIVSDTVMDMPKGEASVRKWDWQLAFALYMNGMGPSEIIRLPEFAGMTEPIISTKITSQGWAKTRERYKLEKAAYLSRSLQEARDGAIDSHFKFLLREVELEREVIKNRVKTSKLTEQSSRLDILKRYHELAEKALGIEGESTGDKAKDSDRWLIAAQINIHAPKNGENKGSINAQDIFSAIKTLPAIKNATTGRTEAGNGIGDELGDEQSHIGYDIEGIIGEMNPADEPPIEPTAQDRWCPYVAPDSSPDELLEQAMRDRFKEDSDELPPPPPKIKRLGRFPKRKATIPAES
jgi:hypothetical protein